MSGYLAPEGLCWARAFYDKLLHLVTKESDVQANAICGAEPGTGHRRGVDGTRPVQWQLFKERRYAGDSVCIGCLVKADRRTVAV